MVSLMSSQAINFILPLITYPHIIKVVGLARYGEVQFILTTMVLLGLLIDYGYSFRAPREVALLKESKAELALLVSKIVTYKFLVFFGLTIGIFLFAYFFYPQKFLLFLGGLIFLLNYTMSPSWFFQGVERMEYIAMVDVAAKVIFTGLIFFMVRLPQDYIYILPLWGLGGVISSVVGLTIIWKNYRLPFKAPSRFEFIKEVKAGYPLFVSNLSMVVLSNSQIIIIGLIHGSAAVGLFAIAEKIIKIPWTFAQLFSQVIYPRVCVLNKQGYKNVLRFYNQMLPFFYTGSIIVLVIMWLFAPEIVGYFTKEFIPEIVNTLKILVFSVVIILLNVPLQQYILANDMHKQLMKIFLAASITNVVLTWALVFYYSYYGAAISSVLTMALLFICFSVVTKKSINKLSPHE